MPTYPDNDSVLNDAANDARDVADELRRDGFAVETGINLTGEAMRQALERLYGESNRAASRSSSMADSASRRPRARPISCPSTPRSGRRRTWPVTGSI
jgi:hypothetical protein